MANSNARSTLSFHGHPLHAMLVPIPVVCFVGTLATDIAYWRDAYTSVVPSGLTLSALVVAADLGR